ncbi:hypothetical protein [Rubinisphaera brasiliensis]|nr:hypothetical protein [Rubinisphaera brasiliensis]
MVDRTSRLMLCRWGMTLFFGLSMFGYLLQIATILSAFSAPENRIQLMGVVMLAPCVLLFSLASYLFSIAVEKHVVEGDSKGVFFRCVKYILPVAILSPFALFFLG